MATKHKGRKRSTRAQSLLRVEEQSASTRVAESKNTISGQGEKSEAAHHKTGLRHKGSSVTSADDQSRLPAGYEKPKRVSKLGKRIPDQEEKVESVQDKSGSSQKTVVMHKKQPKPAESTELSKSRVSSPRQQMEEDVVLTPEQRKELKQKYGSIIERAAKQAEPPVKKAS